MFASVNDRRSMLTCLLPSPRLNGFLDFTLQVLDAQASAATLPPRRWLVHSINECRQLRIDVDPLDRTRRGQGGVAKADHFPVWTTFPPYDLLVDGRLAPLLLQFWREKLQPTLEAAAIEFPCARPVRSWALLLKRTPRARPSCVRKSRREIRWRQPAAAGPDPSRTGSGAWCCSRMPPSGP